MTSDRIETSTPYIAHILPLHTQRERERERERESEG